MTTEQTLKSISASRKILSDFLRLYAKILVTFICGLFFLVFAVVLFVDRADFIPIQSSFIFWGVAFSILFISYLIHRNGLTARPNLLILAIWTGNVFGFLFNVIYVVVNLGSSYNYTLNFGGIEKLVFHTEHGNLNMIETMYGFVGGMLFIIAMSLATMYGLSMRDKFRKESRKLMIIGASLFAVLSGFLFFLLVLLLVAFYENVVMYLIYSITGSMLFIYGTNLFKKQPRFL